MKQKFELLKSENNTHLRIREFAELEKEVYSLLCEEVYDDANVKTAIAGGKDVLISALRTKNMYPPGIFAEEIATTVTRMYAADKETSVNLIFNDISLLENLPETSE